MENHKTKQEIIDFELHRGNKNEERLRPILEKFFKTNLIHTNDGPDEKFYPFDFYTKSKYIEIKKRYNKKNQYPTTIIGKNKYELGLKYRDLGYKVYFIFDFTDELTFYRIKKGDSIITFKDKWVYRKDIGQLKLHTEIPINLLKEIKQ